MRGHFRTPLGHFALEERKTHDVVKAPYGYVGIRFGDSAQSGLRTRQDSKEYADVLDTTIVACPTNGRIGTDGVTIATVDSCGKFWKIVSGKAKVTSDGMITASVGTPAK